MTFFNGLLYSLIAAVIWGCVQVIYFNNIIYIPPLEIVAHRGIWAFFFLFILIIIRKKTSNYFEIFKNKKHLFYLLSTSILISSNWFFLLIAITFNKVQDAAMGYFISPIFSLGFGYIFLKEKLSKIQFLSIILIILAIMNLVINLGTVPWIALSLATTWSIYGLIRKKTNVDSEVGVFFETSMLVPIFFIYCLILNLKGIGHFELDDKFSMFFLIGAGFVTAVPLFFFNLGVKLIPLGLAGIIFYVVPTLQFLTSIIYLEEIIYFYKIISFVLIWIAIIMFILESVKNNKRLS